MASGKKETPQSTIKQVEYAKDFRNIYIDGAQGTMIAKQGSVGIIKFGLYTDNLSFKNASEFTVKRTQEATIVTSIPVAKSLATLILDTIKDYENDIKEKK